MLSHDEAQDAQKSIVDAHYEYEETRESRCNTHIQDTVNVQTQKHVSIAYTCRSNVNIRACVRARISYMSKITRGFIREFFSTILLPVLVTIHEDVSSQTTGYHCDINRINDARINHVTKWRETESSFLDRSNIVQVHEWSTANQGYVRGTFLRTSHRDTIRDNSSMAFDHNGFDSWPCLIQKPASLATQNTRVTITHVFTYTRTTQRTTPSVARHCRRAAYFARFHPHSGDARACATWRVRDVWSFCAPPQEF